MNAQLEERPATQNRPVPMKNVRSYESNQVLEKIRPEMLSPELVRRLPLEFLKSQTAIPVILDSGETAVALADALNVEAYDAIVSVLDRPCRRVICSSAQIEQAISQCYYQSSPPVEQQQEPVVQEQPAPALPDDGLGRQTHAEDLLNVTSKAPAIKLVNRILFQAVHSRASDIHIEPYEDHARVRFRVDGVLHNVCTLPKQQMPAMLSRMKIMASLNIAERRLPQDGQSRVKIGEDLVDVRVSTIPTLGGERVMLRLLDKGRGELGLHQIGFSSEILATFRNLITMPHGIILLTGPTGSGKTTTLYAALNELNGEEQNILTVEDPIEYQLPGIGQMQVKPKIDLTFASCLRHILRQDPDVIMIGEIRDRETAEIAIQSSLTGHLVLSTLHTNDAASAVTRLIDMGIEPYLISSSVVAVMAQRLIRVICPRCKTPAGPSDRMLEIAGDTSETMEVQGKFYEGHGCDHCMQSGYLGRSGIFELLTIDDDIKGLITARHGSHIVKDKAIEKGMRTLRQDGLRKARAGETTLEEVCRVTLDTVRSEPPTAGDDANILNAARLRRTMIPRTRK